MQQCVQNACEPLSTANARCRRRHRSRSTRRAVSPSTTTSPLTAVISSSSTFYWRSLSSVATMCLFRSMCTASSTPECRSQARRDFDHTRASCTSHCVSCPDVIYTSPRIQGLITRTVFQNNNNNVRCTALNNFKLYPIVTYIIIILDRLLTFIYAFLVRGAACGCQSCLCWQVVIVTVLANLVH